MSSFATNSGNMVISLPTLLHRASLLLQPKNFHLRPAMEMSEQYLWPKPGNSSWGLWQHHLDLGALIPMAKRTASPRLMGWVGAGPMPCITTCNSHFNIYFRDDVLGGNHPHSGGGEPSSNSIPFFTPNGTYSRLFGKLCLGYWETPAPSQLIRD